jgi:hypothetical protein
MTDHDHDRGSYRYRYRADYDDREKPTTDRRTFADFLETERRKRETTTTPGAFWGEDDEEDARDLEDARRHLEALRWLTIAIAPCDNDFDDCAAG